MSDLASIPRCQGTKESKSDKKVGFSMLQYKSKQSAYQEQIKDGVRSVLNNVCCGVGISFVHASVSVRTLVCAPVEHAYVGSAIVFSNLRLDWDACSLGSP